MSLRMATCCAIMLGLLAGCNTGGMVPVEGTATLDGKPLVGAVVRFMPPDGHGRIAAGVTDDVGRFVLTTLKEKDGAVPGTYKVVVVKVKEEKVPENAVPVVLGPQPPSAPGEKRRPDAGKMMARTAAKMQSAPQETPAGYADPKTTPFEEVVPSKGRKNIVLKLDSKFKPAPPAKEQ